MEALFADLNQIRRDVPVMAQEGHDAVAQETLALSQPLVPVKTGDLKASGRVRRDGERTIVEYTAEHAAEVHERTDIPHPNGGQAKYLEVASNQADLTAIDRAVDRAF